MIDCIYTELNPELVLEKVVLCKQGLCRPSPGTYVT